MGQITKEDLYHLEASIKEHIDLKVKALPCQEHDKTLSIVMPRLRRLEVAKAWLTGWAAAVGAIAAAAVEIYSEHGSRK